MNRGIIIFLSPFLIIVYLWTITPAISQSIGTSIPLSLNKSCDSISLCVKIIDSRLENGQWVDFQYRNFTYDEYNIVTEYSVSEFVRGSIIHATKTFNSYDRHGHLTGQTGQLRMNGIWKNMESGCHMEYDQKGNRVKYVDYSVEDSKEKIVSVVESAYDEAGNEILKKVKKLGDTTFIPINQITNSFNDRKQLVEKMSKIWDDSQWIPATKDIYAYDEKGRLLELSLYKPEKPFWVSNNRSVYHYDENARTSEEISQSYVNGKWISENRITTHLDIEGNIREVETAVYSSEFIWRTDLRTIYEYKRVPVDLPIIGKPVATVSEQVIPPPEFRLDHNFPNPFNATTQIQYYVPFTANVSLKVYDILGREVATLVDEERQPGEYSVLWDGKDVASGVYFYRMAARGFSQVRKMNLIK